VCFRFTGIFIVLNAVKWLRFGRLRGGKIAESAVIAGLPTMTKWVRLEK